MRRNPAPVMVNQSQAQRSLSHRRSILNHLRQIGTMVNAPARSSIRLQREPPINNHVQESQDDDDYLDDQIFRESQSEEQSSDEQILFDPVQRKLTLQQINSLPKVQLQNKIEGTCVICIQDWQKKDQCVTLPCAHKFHENCIKDWLLCKNKCPYCNSAVFK